MIFKTRDIIMKTMKLLAILAIAISSDMLNASFQNDKEYKSNCTMLQDALTIAIDARKDGMKNVLTMTMLTPSFNKEQLISCRKNYEQQHLGVFQANPAMIAGNQDGMIQIRVMDLQEADELQEQVRQEWLKSQKRN